MSGNVIGLISVSVVIFIIFIFIGFWIWAECKKSKQRNERREVKLRALRQMFPNEEINASDWSVYTSATVDAEVGGSFFDAVARQQAKEARPPSAQVKPPWYAKLLKMGAGREAQGSPERGEACRTAPPASRTATS
eukprot:Selendium_serpulae@DN5950_c0_g4_i1.p2